MENKTKPDYHTSIKAIVDKAFEEMSKEPVFFCQSNIDVDMIDHSAELVHNQQLWRPIDSIIEDKDLNQLELKIGYKLPEAYRTFLKYKHFYSLYIPDGSIGFPPHLPDKNCSALLELIFEYHVPELVIGQGYIYFADFYDYGLLCFDTNANVENADYPVVYICHDELDDEHNVHLYANNFMALLEGDDNTSELFIDKLNTLP